MQEEVENRTLTLVVSGTKFTGRMFKHFLSGLCQTYSQVRTGCCFANAAFLVGDGDDLRVH